VPSCPLSLAFTCDVLCQATKDDNSGKLAYRKDKLNERLVTQQIARIKGSLHHYRIADLRRWFQFHIQPGKQAKSQRQLRSPIGASILQRGELFAPNQNLQSLSLSEAIPIEYDLYGIYVFSRQASMYLSIQEVDFLCIHLVLFAYLGIRGYNDDGKAYLTLLTPALA